MFYPEDLRTESEFKQLSYYYAKAIYFKALLYLSENKNNFQKAQSRLGIKLKSKNNYDKGADLKEFFCRIYNLPLDTHSKKMIEVVRKKHPNFMSKRKNKIFENVSLESDLRT